jgi:hypothetical protein
MRPRYLQPHVVGPRPHAHARPGNHYTIMLADERPTCTCMDFRCRKRACKHIRLILQELGISDQPGQWREASNTVQCVLCLVQAGPDCGTASGCHAAGGLACSCASWDACLLSCIAAHAAGCGTWLLPWMVAHPADCGAELCTCPAAASHSYAVTLLV